MISKRLASVAVLLAAGAVLLSACGPTKGSASAGAPEVKAPAGSAAAVSDTDVKFVDGLATANGVEAGTGDLAGPGASPEAKAQWLQVASGSTFELNPLLFNGRGRAMYRFDKDTAKPSKSACEDACAKLWPPVVVGKGATIYLKDVEKKAIGFLDRADGTRQLTVEGWPAYFYSKDTQIGDANGHGVGGTWFGLRPDGGKATAGTPVTRDGSENTANLFDKKDFVDGNRESLSGLDCRNASSPKAASSVKVKGKVKLWSEKDCKGKSLVVDSDIADLSTVGFDNAVSSVFLG